MASRLSLSGRRWRLIDSGSQANTLRERLLRVRPVGDEEAFFSPSLARDLHDPALLRGMDRALERLDAAIDQNEPIAVFGDYDVDGMCGAAIVTEVLRAMGSRVSTVVPSRLTDGYGLSLRAVEAVAAHGARVLITVDCGISNVTEISRAAELGLSVIVCDHHELPPALPHAATSILHPRQLGDTYPFKHLTGTGVALKLAHALIELRSPADPDRLFHSLLDLAALGTLADMGELTGENRTIVHAGLAQLSTRRRPGVRALLARAKIEEALVTEEHVGFQIAPRLNAAGRMAHPRTALRLLLAPSDAEASHLAEELELLNNARRVRTAEIEQEALKLLTHIDAPAVVLASPGWSIGILGIVAARLGERFHKPVVLFEQREGTLVGSARTANGFNVYKALENCRDLYTSFGGHEKAAGITLPLRSFPVFKERFYAACSSLPAPAAPELDVTTHLLPAELTIESARTLRAFRPFGAGYPTPLFLLSNLELRRIQPMGDGSHLRLEVLPGGPSAPPASLTAFGWGRSTEALRQARFLDAAIQLGTSTYRGMERLELRVVDVRSHTP